MPFRPWSTDQTEHLTLFWKNGFSLSELAEEMNASFCVTYFTRNAIAGKVNRMNLRDRDRPKRAPKARPPRKPRELSAAVSKPPPPPPPRESVVPPTVWLDLIDLGSDTCRFPYGDRSPFAFCGCKVAPDSPYCPVHTELCLNYPPSNLERKYL